MAASFITYKGTYRGRKLTSAMPILHNVAPVLRTLSPKYLLHTATGLRSNLRKTFGQKYLKSSERRVLPEDHVSRQRHSQLFLINRYAESLQNRSRRGTGGRASDFKGECCKFYPLLHNLLQMIKLR